MTAGDGYPPHAGDLVNPDGPDGPDDPVPPARKVPTVPGPPVPSWPKGWAVSPPGQPAPYLTAPVDTAPLDTAPLDASDADEWQRPPDAYDTQPEAGSWFTPLDTHPDDPVGGPAVPSAGPAFRPPSREVPPPAPAFRPSGQEVPPPAPAFRLSGQDVPRPPGAPRQRPRAASRRRWILPLAGGVAMVLAITAVVLATRPRHPSPGSSASTARPSATARPMPSVMGTDALLRDLNQDLQSQNETAFLNLVAAGARPSVRLWWENQQAIGFTTGAVLPTAVGDQVSVDNKGDATTTVLAGTHNALDPVDSNGKPANPCDRYQIGLHFASSNATGQITSWTALDGDPWDQGSQLYVRKAANVVVAGLPGDSRFVNEALPLAETAARYDIGLLDHGSRHDLHQNGFVVFVSAEATAHWSGPAPRPPGWPLEFRGGRTVTLPGPGVSADGSALDGGASEGITGGARALVTPFEQDHGTARGETLTLVRDFMLDVLAPDNGEQVLRPVPSWALEGIAIMAQDLYAANPNPAPKTYNFGTLTTALRKLPPSYRAGHLPTSSDLFSGSLTAEQDWNDVAASVYAYIGTTYGVNQMLAAAVLLQENKSTPFGNVVAPAKKGSSSFYSPGTIEGKWRAALARM